jgi:peptidoglycan hydrolase-like protein with peptidoglycan-binding domain
VIAFQKAHGISPAVGYVGKITRGIINSQLK